MTPPKSSWKIAATIGLLFPFCAYSQIDLDPFDMDGDARQSAASAMLGENGCFSVPINNPLRLIDAVEHSLCGHPTTREAWAKVKEQAAAVGAAYGAFLPTISVSTQYGRDRNTTTVNNLPALDNRTLATTNVETASLSWVLYDFGDRLGALENATDLLEASKANEEASLQTVFYNTAKDYYTAQAMQGVLTAAVDTERIAKESFNAATRRAERDVSPISDVLQAQTAYIQATFNRIKAESDWQSALGALASDMAVRPDSMMVLPDVSDGVRPDAEFEQSVSGLIDEALRSHPSIRSAIAQQKAAEASVTQAEAEGLPSVSFIAKTSRNQQPDNQGLGLPTYPAIQSDNYVGLQVTVPLFEGFTREYKVKQSKAQAEQRQAAVDEARQQVGIDVWTSYQLVETSTRNLTNSEKLLSVAQQSYAVARRRYETGIGSIIELLNVQTALAGAQKQRIQSLTDWRTNRLQLAAKLGKLGVRQLKEE